MSKVKILFVAVLLSSLTLSANATQSCGGEAGWASQEFTTEVEGGNLYSHEAGIGTFLLVPNQYGWQIEMHENENPIVVFSPPARPVESNPTNIAGWHFRNLDNTGPNLGEVNAPQHRRRFAFGTMAIDPTRNPELIAPTRQEGFGGLGELVIEDLSLTPPNSEERAAITEMKFTVCLVWQGGGDRLEPIVEADPGIAFDSLLAEMKACGLDTSLYRLSDRASGRSEGYQAPYLTPDMDGDNIPDRVVPITRLSDDAPGLAICLMGENQLRLTTFDQRIGRFFDPNNFVVADGWHIFQKAEIFSSDTDGPPPELIGDAIDIFKEPSWRALIYLDERFELSSYWYGPPR